MTHRTRKYLEDIENLPNDVKRWMGMTVEQLRAIVGSSEAPVYHMSKAELVEHLVGDKLDNLAIGEWEES